MIAVTQTMTKHMGMRTRRKRRRLEIRCQLTYHLNHKNFLLKLLWKKILSCTKINRNCHKSNQNNKKLKQKILLLLLKNNIRSQLKQKNNLTNQLKLNISTLKCQKLSANWQKQMHISANFTHINLQKSKLTQKIIN